MGRYFLKRLLIFAPSMLVIIFMAFTMKKCAPGDPVDTFMGGASTDFLGADDQAATRETYIDVRKRLGEDLPDFYFSLTSACYPDTLHRIIFQPERESLQRLAYKFGNWENVQKWKIKTDELIRLTKQVEPPKSFYDDHISFRGWMQRLKISTTTTEIDLLVRKSRDLLAKAPASYHEIANFFTEVEKTWRDLVEHPQTANRYIPTVHWYGFQNQFHKFLVSIFTGDLGISYSNKQSIGSKIMDHLPYSVLLNFISVILAYLISIPIGVHSARNRKKNSDKVFTTGVFILYSLPSFWVATMLITYFANPEFLGWFPPSGIKDVGHESFSFWGQLWDYIHHLILPTICYTYSAFAFLSRQMRSATLESLSSDYIRTARAKGLSEKKVVWKHAFRNSLIPIITVFGGIFPGMVGGSIILESIFSIPGMGKLTIDSAYNDDYPVIIAIFTLVGIMTLIGILVADILYALVDPRITFNKNGK